MSKRKPNGVQLLIRAVVKDPDGKVLSDTGQKPAKSFVIQFLQFFKNLFDAVNTERKRTDGTNGNIYFDGNTCSMAFLMNAPINASYYGIVVGTGDTPADNENHKLETQLTHGVTVGKITHGAMVMGTTGVVDANVDTEHKRAFTNNTGVEITVKETGIYVMRFSVNFSFCIVRDVLSPSVIVPDKCSLTVYYTFRTTV